MGLAVNRFSIMCLSFSHMLRKLRKISKNYLLNAPTVFDLQYEISDNVNNHSEFFTRTRVSR